MRFISIKSCLLVAASLGLAACSQGVISQRTSKIDMNAVPVSAMARANLTNLTDELGDLLSSELKLEDILAAISENEEVLSTTVDTDGDELLSIEELLKGSISLEDAEEKLNKLDYNEDGKLDYSDFKAWQEDIVAKIKAAKEKEEQDKIDFEAKRAEICAAVQKRIEDAEGDAFVKAMAMKHLLAKCANIIAGEDSDEETLEDIFNDANIVAPSTEPSSTPEPSTTPSSTPAPSATPTPAPQPDMVCKSVTSVNVKVNQDNKQLVDILVRICNK